MKRFSYLLVASLLTAQDLLLETPIPQSELADEIALIQQEPPIPTTLPAPSLVPAPKRKIANLAAGLSLFPGLGHAYLGDYRTAGQLFSVTSLSAGATLLSSNQSELVDLASLTSNLWAYNIYAAYRDARMHNGGSGYCYLMPKDSFSDLAVAPLRFSILRKPEVWGGLLGALTTVVAINLIASQMYAKPFRAPLSLSTHSNPNPLFAFPIGIGEESLFRGYLQSTLSETFTPWGGIALSSLLFGAAHIGNAQELSQSDRRQYYTFSIPLITTLGAYMGWATHKNGSLQESVALHVWYDFILMAIAASADLASTGRTDASYSFSF